MTSSQKADFWQQHINTCKQSGLTQRDYCQQNNLSFASLGYWRKRLKPKAANTSKLIPVAVSRPVLVNLYLPSGVRIEAPVQSLPELLPLLAGEII
jgi:hypothetical protein